MKKWQYIGTAMFLVFALGVGWAQDAGQQPGDSAQQPADTTAPAPAFGQDNPPPQTYDNPPLSGLDTPSLEPHAAARSFLIPGVHLSEAVDSNVGGTSGNAAIHGVTRAMGSLMLQRLWSHYQTALNYYGGAAFYSGFSRSSNQIHELDVDQRILWRTGQLALRDSFSYLPEGSFGYGTYGESGAYQAGLGLGGNGGGIAGGVSNGIFGPGQFGSLGQQPRITNSAIVDVTETLTPRSSFTVAGGYGLVHFTSGTSGGLIDSRQTSAQAGYNYQLNRKDQIALVYGFQDFQYPNIPGTSFTTHTGHVLYAHRISGRLDLVLGVGPQLTRIDSPLFGSTRRLSVSGRASLRYRFSRATVGLSYDRLNTNGSGFFLGASSDVVRLSVSRPVSRLWDVNGDVGYTRNSQILPGIAGVAAQAQSYQYEYAGGVAHRQLGRYFGLFLSYQFNRLAFDSSFCTAPGPCANTSTRHVAAVGLDWHPRPIRLD